ncbi:MAG TPA: NIPSNAP family protein [Acidobacteriaceae bacterium]|nr:NIPSNAP family protein [Acidobacteriaceae bacterium]
MERRKFVTSSLAAAAALGVAGAALPQADAAGPAAREYYELRKYHMVAGPQTKQAEDYVANALIPALNRLGLGPVGAFYLTFGPETPTLYLLIPGGSVEALVTAELRLAEDAVFMKAAEPFWNAPATQPAFVRVESALMIAFAGWPKLTPPAAAARQGKRIFQLRTYESATNQDHVRKVEMFHHGEFEIFARSGCEAIFYADTLIGPRLPNLTYMLTFSDMADLDAKWKRFSSDPDWMKLKASPRYAFEQIVSNISNLILTPTAFSQI